jgi:hypothetical protein
VTVQTQPASRLPAWRFLVIAAVGVLAVAIGVAAGTVLLVSRTAAVGAGSSYVPASAPFYFEMRLEASEAQDGALREMLGHFPPIEGIDLDRPLYDQIAVRIDELLADEGAGVTWSGDVAPWFDGRIGFAVTEIPLEAMSAAMPTDEMAMPGMVVLVGVTDATAAAASIERLIAETGEAPTFTEQTHGGVTIRVSDDDGAYALTDDQLLIAPSADDVIAALDARDSGSNTLAEAEEITRLTDALPSDWLAFGIYDFSDVMSAAISEGASASPGMAEAFGALLEHQPLRGAMAVTAAGDRLAVDVVTDAPTGPFAAENAERGLAGEVPADTIYYAEAGNLGTTLAAVIEPLKEAMASMPGGEDQVGTVEAALGADLEELVSWIDDGAVAIGFDGEEPYGGMVLVPNDMDAASRRLGQLASFAGLAALDPSSGVTVEESTVGSASVTTIRWEDPNAEPEAMLPTPTGLAVQYAVTDDRALIGLGETFVGRVLALEPADALGSVERFTSAIDELGGASNIGVAWVDLAGAREALETYLLPRFGMLDTEGFYESEIRPWLLPLDRIVSVTRLDGGVLVQRGALLVD